MFPCKNCESLKAEVEKIKFEFKMKEKEIVKLLKLQHKEEQMSFRERIRQEAFDSQMQTMNDVVKDTLTKIIDERLKNIENKLKPLDAIEVESDTQD